MNAAWGRTPAADGWKGVTDKGNDEAGGGMLSRRIDDDALACGGGIGGKPKLLHS